MSEQKIIRCDCGCAQEAVAGTFGAPNWIKVYGGQPSRTLDFATWACLSRWSLNELNAIEGAMVAK